MQATEDRPQGGTALTSATVRRVDRWALAVIIGAIVLRAAVIAAGSFYWDDFVLQGRAARLPLNVDFLFYSHDGHIMPAAMGVAWVTERVAPLNYIAPVATLIVLQAAVAVLTWRLFRRLFGPRPLALVFAGALIVCTATLPSAAWWAAGLNSMPLQLGMLGIAFGVVDIVLADRAKRGIALVVGSFIVATLFFEKALLLPLVVLGLLWVLGSTPGLRGVWQAIRGNVPLVVLGGLVWIALAAVYVTNSDRGLLWPQDWGPVIDTFRTGLTDAIVPSMAAGPLAWEPAGYASAYATPPWWFRTIALELFIALVALGCVCYSRARRAWLVAALYAFSAAALYAFGRVPGGGVPSGIASMRYIADAMLLLFLAAAFSLMPLRNEPDSPRMRAVRAWLADHPRSFRGGTAVILGGWIFLTILSTGTFAQIWANNPARGWLQEARTTMAAGAKDGPVLNQQVPPFVLYGLATPYNQIDWLLAPLPEKPEISGQTNNLRILNERGALTPATIDGPDALPGPKPACGWPVAGPSSTVVFGANVFAWEWTLELDYTAAAATSTTLTFGPEGKPVPVNFEQGSGTVFVRLEGGGTTLTFGPTPESAGVCVRAARVGNPQAEVKGAKIKTVGRPDSSISAAGAIPGGLGDLQRAAATEFRR